MFGRLVTAAGTPLSRLARKAIGPLAGSRPLDPTRTTSIAFIKLDHLGDLLMATPLLRALKSWAPAARITVYTRPVNAEMALKLPCIDEVEMADVPWIRPESSSSENVRACFTLASELRACAYDLAVDLRYHNRLDSLLLSMSGARSRLGFESGGLSFGLTHCAPWPQERHEVERAASALRRFGIPVGDLTPEFTVSDGDAAAARRIRTGARRFVVIHVGAGNLIKRWMPERFAWVAREIARRARVKVVVLAGRGEEACGEPVVRALPPSSRLDLRGRLRLPEIAALIQRSSLFIGNDGGAAHVAASVGARTLIVFSGTNVAAQWKPLGKHVHVIEKSVPCKPCHSTTCPFDQACLRAVKVNEVVAAGLTMLRERGKR